MKPLTRKEMLLNAAANGTLDNFEPATREEVFTKEAFANAGGGVTSWNDLTDKPFGEEVGERVDILDEITTEGKTSTSGNSVFYTLKQYNYHDITDNPFEEGEMYSVVFDGTVFKCECKYEWADGVGYYYLSSNGNLFTSDAEFGLAFNDMNSRLEFYVPTTDVHTVLVYQQDITITPLDPKYLPVMTVNVNVDAEVYDAGSCDKSFAEIKAHLDAGGSVDMTIHRGTSLSVKMHYVSCTDTSVNFSALEVSLNGSSTPNYYYVWGLTIGNVGENDIIWYCRHKVTDTTL